MIYVSGLFGIVFYNTFFKDYGFRSLLILFYVGSAFRAFMNLTFALRWSLEFGISDKLMVILLDIIGPIKDTFSVMFCVVIANKLSPHHIETSAFAAFTSISNLSGSLIAPSVGSFICKIVGVNNQNLDKYYILAGIQMICYIIGIL
jgi:hypothetical protein